VRATAGPLDFVFQDSALESVSGDAKQHGGFNNVATRVKRVLTKSTLSGRETKRFQHDRHTVRVEQFLPIESYVNR